MILNEVKRLEQVAYISQNNQPTKTKLPPSLKSQTDITATSKAPVPPCTALALSAGSNPYDQSKSKKVKQFKGPRKISCHLCGSFQCKLSVKERMAVANSSGLCLNCLGSGLVAIQCQSQWRSSL